MRRENTKSNIDFKSIFDSLPDLYLLLDRDFNIVGVSDAYLQATMVSRKQILGKMSSMLFLIIQTIQRQQVLRTYMHRY
ncbi:PAS domain-containing protein [Legionella pneumophila]|nr:PAS domain-containing protein [Legionella pneumophila]